MLNEVVDRTNNRYNQPAIAVIICKNLLLSIGMKHLLEGNSFSITATVPDVANLSEHCSVAKPDLFIVDGSDTIEQTIEAVKHLKGTYPDVRIIVIAGTCDLNLVRLGRSAGVNGFCQSGSSREVLIKSLEMVMLGETVLPATVMASLLSGSGADSAPKPHDSEFGAAMRSGDPMVRKLSVREAEILGCLMEGSSNKVIARKLDVAEATIKVHIKAILRKIGAANRTQAAMWASSHLPTSDGPSLAA